MVSASGAVGKKLLKGKNGKSSDDDDFPLEKSSGDYKEKVKIIPMSEMKSKLISDIDVSGEDIKDPDSVDEMIDSFGMEEDDYFTHYEIFVFTTELDSKSEAYNCKISKKGINHAAIKLLATNGNYYTIEWGNITSDWEIDFESIAQTNDYWFEHRTQKDGKIKQSIWKGCRAIYGKINKKITAHDVATHAVQWNEKLGSRGKSSYPFNCRGYVDSFLVSVLKKGIIDWVGEGMF